jgi:hypothetical protein
VGSSCAKDGMSETVFFMPTDEKILKVYAPCEKDKIFFRRLCVQKYSGAMLI